MAKIVMGNALPTKYLQQKQYLLIENLFLLFFYDNRLTLIKSMIKLRHRNEFS
jgi:hypothetical protein